MPTIIFELPPKDISFDDFIKYLWDTSTLIAKPMDEDTFRIHMGIIFVSCKRAIDCIYATDDSNIELGALKELFHNHMSIALSQVHDHYIGVKQKLPKKIMDQIMENENIPKKIKKEILQQYRLKDEITYERR